MTTYHSNLIHLYLVLFFCLPITIWAFANYPIGENRASLRVTEGQYFQLLLNKTTKKPPCFAARGLEKDQKRLLCGHVLGVFHIFFILVKVQALADHRTVHVLDAHGSKVLGQDGNLAQFGRDRGQLGHGPRTRWSS